METVVREILCGGAEPRTLFKQRLAAPPPQQAELIAALLQCFDLNPAAGVQCLAACLVAAPGALLEQFRHGDRLARVLRAAGGKAPGVADVAVMVLTQGAKAAAAAGGSLSQDGALGGEFWHALARLEGLQRWEDLPPSPARAAAVKLWARRPELAPPGVGAAALARWLAQAPAPEAEKGPLLAAVRRLWAERQAGVAAQAEDVLGALLQDMPAVASQDEHRPSVEWLASALMGGGAGASPRVCGLFASTASAIAAAAVEFLGAPRGRAALLFAWIALYGAVLGGITGGLAAAGADEEACRTVLQLLGEICSLLASKECWRELACALLCVVLRWPADGDSVPLVKAGVGAAAPPLAAWSEFARSVLLELPDRTPDAPLARVLPLLFAALPDPSQDAQPRASMDRCNGTGSACPLTASVAAELRARASSLQAGAGLQNLGNTCYLNSLLQALALTDSLAADLFLLFPPHLRAAGARDGEVQQASMPSPLPPKGAAARSSLAQVFTRLAVARRPVSPSALASLTPFGLRGQQQDVTELARWLFEQLGDAEKDGSLVGRSFGGHARTVVRCTGCGYSQEKLEAFADLSLSATAAGEGGAKEEPASSAEGGLASGVDGSSVAGLLRAYLSEEALSGYRCDACGAVDTSRRRCEITRAPRQLVVTLNRFAYTAEGGQQKVDARVAVNRDLQLPLSPSAGGASTGAQAQEHQEPEAAAGADPEGDSAMAEASPEAGTEASASMDEAAAVESNEHTEQAQAEAAKERLEVAEYSLYAFVTHAGSTPHSGHYVCLGRGSESSLDTAWSRFDDSSVRALPGEATQEALDGHANGSATAYMLFYRRMDSAGEATVEAAAAPPPPPPLPARRRLPARFFAEAVLAELSDMPAFGGARAAAAAALACLRRSLGAGRRQSRHPALAVLEAVSAAGAAAGSVDAAALGAPVWRRRCPHQGLSKFLAAKWPAVGALVMAALAHAIFARLSGWGPL